MKWLSPVLGALIIASPLPDEFGLTLMECNPDNLKLVFMADSTTSYAQTSNLGAGNPQFHPFGPGQTGLIVWTLSRDPISGMIYAGTEI